MLPQSYVGDAKLGVHPQWYIAEKKNLQRPLGSGPQAVEWAAGRKVARRVGAAGSLEQNPKFQTTKRLGVSSNVI